MNELTVFFAKIAAAYFIVTGLGFLISTEFYEKMVHNNANTDPVTLNLSGAVHLLVGLSIVIQHFRWGSFLEGVVTLIGISTVLKGAALIAIPELTLKSPKTNERSLKLSGVGFIIMAIYLGYMSYF